MERYQHTLKKKVSFGGIGLHSGKRVNLTIKPAAANSGFRFTRTDKPENPAIPAFMNKVVDTSLATTIASDEMSVSTTEHLLASLVGLGIDNALIELDSDEVPIMDGSAGPFVHIIKRAGRKRQKEARCFLKITNEIVFIDGDKVIKVQPYDGFKVSCEIEYDHALIRKQRYSIDISSENFTNEIASARTFGFMSQVEMLRENGFALGGSLDNAIVIDQYGILNSEGLRFADEFVRHKVLDLVGDIALLGCPIVGHVTAVKSGHGQHLGLMKQIALHPECWEFVRLEKNGELTVLEKVISKTKEAGNRILPFLLPQGLGAEPMAA